jgi:hypothetical protein
MRPKYLMKIDKFSIIKFDKCLASYSIIYILNAKINAIQLKYKAGKTSAEI